MGWVKSGNSLKDKSQPVLLKVMGFSVDDHFRGVGGGVRTNISRGGTAILLHQKVFFTLARPGLSDRKSGTKLCKMG